MIEISDIIIPITLLIIIIIYLIYTKISFEEGLKKDMADEFEKWKELEFQKKDLVEKQNNDTEKVLGFIIEKNNKVEIFATDKNISRKLEKLEEINIIEISI